MPRLCWAVSFISISHYLMVEHTGIWQTTISTGIGVLVIAADEQELKHIFLPGLKEDEKYLFREDKNHKHPIIAETVKQLGEYSEQKRKYFDLPISLQSTCFNQRVWQLISAIPYGRTANYSSLAEIIGDRNKARAVGGAAHRNPLPIIIPCHRVIGKNGRLTGYAGGLKIKKFLLQLEGYLPAPK